MRKDEVVVGIDLGTTNSEIAAFVDGQVRVLGPKGGKILPSCVGLTPGGDLLVGEAARNQMLVYPERTVRGIKRKMGKSESVEMGGRTFSPPEISALILRQLVKWAEEVLGCPVKKAVITVPAYFSDAQRNATREAGELAGLEVLRILNEPTAASLAYGEDRADGQKVMIYDLGGGTFDVSIVRVEEGVTEVLASHGNNELGGDDFNQLLLDHLAGVFQKEHGVDLREGHPAGYARLWWAVEEAKKVLSSEPYVMVREDALATKNGTPLHLEVEISRDQYEGMIRPLVESTLESVTKAMGDANVTPDDLDAILLVGGSTRTPLVERVLEERSGRKPRKEVHPDLCVALGAGVLASRLGGHQIDRVLVDVCPYGFGISFLGFRGGVEYPYCYKPIITANSALPVSCTEIYMTSHPYQKEVEIQVFQGEDDDALKNILVGDFRVEGLKPVAESSQILCRMRLDVNGILEVTAIEKSTGMAKHVSIQQALKPKGAKDIAVAQARLEDLFRRSGRLDSSLGSEAGVGEESLDFSSEIEGSATGSPNDGDSDSDGSESDLEVKARKLLVRCEKQTSSMHPEDREEALALREAISTALRNKDPERLRESVEELGELLFFTEDA